MCLFHTCESSLSKYCFDKSRYSLAAKPRVLVAANERAAALERTRPATVLIMVNDQLGVGSYSRVVDYARNLTRMCTLVRYGRTVYRRANVLIELIGWDGLFECVSVGVSKCR